MCKNKELGKSPPEERVSLQMKKNVLSYQWELRELKEILNFKQIYRQAGERKNRIDRYLESSGKESCIVATSERLQ